MNHKLNIVKQIKHFWPCQSNYWLYCPSVLVSNKVKGKATSLASIVNLTNVTAVVQCANKYKITHSPLRSITAFHYFVDNVFARISAAPE